MKKKPLKRFFAWVNPLLEVKATKKYGKGIFARKDLKKGDILNIAGGYVLTAKEELKLPKEIRDSGLQISEDFVLTSRKKSETE